jgi:hypothetical protein
MRLLSLPFNGLALIRPAAIVTTFFYTRDAGGLLIVRILHPRMDGSKHF